jgi:hypothetical protein
LARKLKARGDGRVRRFIRMAESRRCLDVEVPYKGNPLFRRRTDARPRVSLAPFGRRGRDRLPPVAPDSLSRTSPRLPHDFPTSSPRLPHDFPTTSPSPTFGPAARVAPFRAPHRRPCTSVSAPTAQPIEDKHRDGEKEKIRPQFRRAVGRSLYLRCHGKKGP